MGHLSRRKSIGRKKAMRNEVEEFDAEITTLNELAELLECDKSNLLKRLKKCGFTPRYIRIKETGNQLNAGLNKKETKAFLAMLKAQGFKVREMPERGAS
jgi:predicted nuclease with TOPRIM domain